MRNAGEREERGMGDNVHLHCTELVGSVQEWSEIKRPGSKCDWGHDVREALTAALAVKP